MDHELLGALRHWLAADKAERDQAADRAFRSVFQAVPRRAPRPGFAERVALAVGPIAPGASRKPWVGWPRTAAAATLGIAGVASVYFGMVDIVPFAARQFVGLVNLSARGLVWVALALQNGLDAWEILGEVGRVIGAAIATPGVTIGLLAIELVGVAALYALHRLLTLEKESA